MDLVFDAALDQWYDWETTTARFLLLNSNYSADRAAHVWVSDVVAWEILVANYARQTVAGQTRTVDPTLHRITYGCSDPNFGGIDASPPGVSTMCLFKAGADDASSLLLAVYDLDATGSGPLKPLMNPAGAYWISQEGV